MEHYYEIEFIRRGDKYSEGQCFEDYEEALHYYNELNDRNDIKEVKFIDVIETDLNEQYTANENAELLYEVNIVSSIEQFDTQDKAMDCYYNAIKNNPKLQKLAKMPVKVYRTVIKKY